MEAPQVDDRRGESPTSVRVDVLLPHVWTETIGRVLISASYKQL